MFKFGGGDTNICGINVMVNFLVIYSAYVVFSTIFSIIFYVFLNFNPLLTFLVTATSLDLTLGILIALDASNRGWSKNLGFLGIFGVIGLIVYHIFSISRDGPKRMTRLSGLAIVLMVLFLILTLVSSFYLLTNVKP